MQDNKITIYVSTLCPFSKELIDDLNAAKVVFEQKWVDKDQAAFVEMYNLTHKKVTPVIKLSVPEIIVLVGYNNEQKTKLQEYMKRYFVSESTSDVRNKPLKDWIID
ncbi:hypothetical protein HGA88_06330 [Candidatus Roizmanbacteria bacterium]|nr:hypothetical protein [Candidatus Roizmanbacteria bacterium]